MISVSVRRHAYAAGATDIQQIRRPLNIDPYTIFGYDDLAVVAAADL